MINILFAQTLGFGYILSVLDKKIGELEFDLELLHKKNLTLENLKSGASTLLVNDNVVSSKVANISTSSENTTIILGLLIVCLLVVSVYAYNGSLDFSQYGAFKVVKAADNALDKTADLVNFTVDTTESAIVATKNLVVNSATQSSTLVNKMVKIMPNYIDKESSNLNNVMNSEKVVEDVRSIILNPNTILPKIGESIVVKDENTGLIHLIKAVADDSQNYVELTPSLQSNIDTAASMFSF